MKIVSKNNRTISNTLLLGVFVSCLALNTEAYTPGITPAIFRPFAPTDCDSMISCLADQINRGNVTGILQQLGNAADLCAKSEDAIADSRMFLQHFIDRMNSQYGTAVTLSQVLQFTRELIPQLPISDGEIADYLAGLSLIGSNALEFAYNDNLGYFQLAGHKNNKFWSWLSVATVTAGAVVVCLFCPEAAAPVISGAVEIGKAIVNNQK